MQIEYSPFTIDIESPDIGLLKTCRELGVATVAYFPLGRGMLTGAYRSLADFEEGLPDDGSPFLRGEFPQELETSG